MLTLRRDFLRLRPLKALILLIFSIYSALGRAGNSCQGSNECTTDARKHEKAFLPRIALIDLLPLCARREVRRFIRFQLLIGIFYMNLSKKCCVIYFLSVIN